MIQTNKYELPESFVRALKKQNYDRKPDWDFSVTELLKPAQIRVLEKRYSDKITEDISERIWALLGSCVHEVLDKAAGKDSLNEERLVVDVDGYTIAGKPDLLEDHTLTDYKVTSVWKVIFGYSPEWEAQLNIYRYLYSKYGFNIDKLQIIAILRDWKASDAENKTDYPKVQVHTFDIPVWDLNVTKEYILDRIKAHKDAENLPDAELPFCTPEERWERPAKYAVMKGKNKRAVKLCETQEQADEYISNDTRSDLWVEYRQGKPVRCEGYCPVAEFCNQYQKELRT